MPDIRLTGAGGSLILFHMDTPRGREVLHELVDFESPDVLTWVDALVVEPRYAADLVAGLRDAGLEVV